MDSIKRWHSFSRDRKGILPKRRFSVWCFDECFDGVLTFNVQLPKLNWMQFADNLQLHWMRNSILNLTLYPRLRFGKRSAGCGRRANECLILEPSELVVMAFRHFYIRNLLDWP
uniref:Uncharacterized protein n=1 Tax=Strigamia maritima TaxID=126957 RepID=T1JM16_STRMM